MDKKMLHMVAFVLVVVGALNWGLIALLNLNLVEAIFGMGMITKVVYIAVGASALWIFLGHKSDCKICK